MSIPVHFLIAWLDIEPLPPITLSKNGRGNRWQIHEAFQTVLARARQQFAEPANVNASLAWPVHAAIMDVVWCQARGRRPDDDNVFARVAAVRDAAQHVGMVLDDKHIRVGEVFYEWALPGEEFCQVQFRIDDAAYLRDGVALKANAAGRATAMSKKEDTIMDTKPAETFAIDTSVLLPDYVAIVHVLWDEQRIEITSCHRDESQEALAAGRATAGTT